MTPEEKELFRPFISFLRDELQLYAPESSERYRYLIDLHKKITGPESLFNLNTRRRLMDMPEFLDFCGFVDEEIKKFKGNVTK